MAICLKCSRKSNQVGVKCPSCGKAYTVCDNHGRDPLGILGRLLVNKLIPVETIEESGCVVSYQAYQPAVDRFLSIFVIQPELLKNPAIKDRAIQIIDMYATVKQPNILAVLDFFEIPEIHSSVVVLEARKGELFSSILKQGEVDAVTLMHIFHQILQAFSAFHLKGLAFPGFSLDNVTVMRSGGDLAFVKLFGVFTANMSHPVPPNAMLNDVYRIGQLALSCITGQKIPIETVELPVEKAFLMPIAQIFLRAIAPEEQRFQSCVELLYAFEAAFDLNSRGPELLPKNETEAVPPKKHAQPRQPVPFEDIIWLHRPPRRED